jgi:hypothetical protein
MADDRLRKLVLMLSSDQPGEVAAAAKAIDRVLKVEGRDWNWLAAKLADNEAPEFRPKASEEPWERHEPDPPSEEPRYAEPEPEPQAGPWDRPAPPPRSAGLRWFFFQWRLWLSGFYGRGKQVVAGLGVLLAFVVLAPALGSEPGGVALALVFIGLILWGCVWLILHAIAFWLREIVTAAGAVIRWFSRSRA